jgi:hypothetical protein
MVYNIAKQEILFNPMAWVINASGSQGDSFRENRPPGPVKHPQKLLIKGCPHFRGSALRKCHLKGTIKSANFGKQIAFFEYNMI